MITSNDYRSRIVQRVLSRSHHRLKPYLQLAQIYKPVGRPHAGCLVLIPVGLVHRSTPFAVRVIVKLPTLKLSEIPHDLFDSDSNSHHGPASRIFQITDRLPEMQEAPRQGVCAAEQLPLPCRSMNTDICGKCDEKKPCSACTRHGVPCSLVEASSAASTSSVVTAPSTAASTSDLVSCILRQYRRRIRAESLQRTKSAQYGARQIQVSSRCSHS